MHYKVYMHVIILHKPHAFKIMQKDINKAGLIFIKIKIYWWLKNKVYTYVCMVLAAMLTYVPLVDLTSW